jgi:hypothetical protein
MKSPSKFCTIYQLERIQRNNYLSEDMKTEYCKEEVDSLIFEKKAKQDEAKLKRMMREVEELLP